MGANTEKEFPLVARQDEVRGILSGSMTQLRRIVRGNGPGPLAEVGAEGCRDDGVCVAARRHSHWTGAQCATSL